MANCRTCGEKAGTLRSECDPCKTIRVTEEHRIAAEQEAARSEAEREAARIAEQERQERYTAYMQVRFTEIEALVAAGRTPYLHRRIYTAIDSYMNGNAVSNSPDFSDVDVLGWEGWELVGVIPKTKGFGLENSSAGTRSWGGGVGGLVTGCYLVMRLPVDSYVLAHQRDLVIEFFAEQFPG